MYKYLEGEMEDLFKAGGVLHRKKHDHGLLKELVSEVWKNRITGNDWPSVERSVVTN